MSSITKENFITSLEVVEHPTVVVNLSTKPAVEEGLPEECSICSEPFEDPVRTPCNHIFCRDDLVRWMDQSNQCPFCRTELYEIDESMEDEEEEDDEMPESITDRFDLDGMDYYFYSQEFLREGQPGKYEVLEWLEARVDCDSIFPELMALIDFLKPDASESDDPNMLDICRPEWILVADTIYDFLSEVDGQLFQGHELLEMMTLRIRAALMAANRGSPAYAVPLFTEEVTFQNDLDTVLGAAVSICQRDAKHAHQCQQVERIAQNTHYTKHDLDIEISAQSTISNESLADVSEYPNKTIINAFFARQLSQRL